MRNEGLGSWKEAVRLFGCYAEANLKVAPEPLFFSKNFKIETERDLACKYDSSVHFSKQTRSRLSSLICYMTPFFAWAGHNSPSTNQKRSSRAATSSSFLFTSRAVTRAPSYKRRRSE